VHLVTLGDLSLDIVVASASDIAKGSDVNGTISFRVGGSAANTARAFAALGGDSVFVGAVGDDALGRRLVERLRADGVEPVVAIVAGVPTARIAVLIGEGGERSFVASRGAADCLTASTLRDELFRDRAGLHLPGYSLLAEPLASAATFAGERAHRAGAIVSVDLASAQPLRQFGREAARAAVASIAPDVLFANEDEAEAIGGRLEELSATVVVKLGAAGCAVNGVRVPTEPIAATDTTGAGDAFDAGFLFALLADPPASVADAARAGHAAARALLTGPRTELDPW